jgi:hypothetical protein
MLNTGGAKKPGPRGPGLKFASVGAPANHLPEGKKLRASGNQSGRITAPACHAARCLYCKFIPRRTTRQLTCQPCAIGDRPDNLCDGHFASTNEGVSRFTLASGGLSKLTQNNQCELKKMSVKSEHRRSRKRSARASFFKRFVVMSAAEHIRCTKVVERADASSSSAARWRPESRGTPARARPS